MIRKLHGKVEETSEKTLILNVGGVGYLVFGTPGTLNARAGDALSVWTYLAVREDALDLYGFREKKELDWFLLLLSVSGIGPKSALQILSVVTPETLHMAIAKENPGYLTKVSGIGKKTAEKIVHELKDKTAPFEMEAGMESEMDAIEALSSLGYSRNEARDALKKLPKELEGTSQRVKAALKLLGKS